MPDREKVIRAWEIFRNSNPYEICNGKEFRAIREPEYCMGQMIEDTIALLKEQEPVEPKVSSTEQRCGNCNKVIEMDGWIACPWCGKPIAWNEWWNKNGGQAVKRMPDREKYIEVLSKAVKTMKESNEDAQIKISLECIEDILELLKEKPEIVRCKDCKYSETMKPWDDIVCTQNGATHCPDWFCADGQRR